MQKHLPSSLLSMIHQQVKRVTVITLNFYNSKRAFVEWKLGKSKLQVEPLDFQASSSTNFTAHIMHNCKQPK